MGEDLLDDRSLVNEGDDPHGTATLGAEQPTDARGRQAK